MMAPARGRAHSRNHYKGACHHHAWTERSAIGGHVQGRDLSAIGRPGRLHSSSHASTSARSKRTYRPSHTHGIAPERADSSTHVFRHAETFGDGGGVEQGFAHAVSALVGTSLESAGNGSRSREVGLCPC